LGLVSAAAAAAEQSRPTGVIVDKEQCMIVVLVTRQ